MAKGAHDANRGINYEEKCKTGDAQPTAYTPKDDEVALPVPDDYFHLVFKTKAMHKWALENGFDFVYKCDTDTYCRRRTLDEERVSSSMISVVGNLARSTP